MSKRQWIEKVCKECGKTYKARSDHKTSQYCSRQCAGVSRRKKVIICPQCNKEFLPSKKDTKFCSNKCASNSRTTKQTIKCDQCGSEIIKPSCHIKETNFCSRQCYHDWRSENLVGEKAYRWNGGIYRPYGKYKYIKQEDGSYKAEHRIVVEKYLGRELTSEEIIHHIDGNGNNNLINNLQIVSRTEHPKIHAEKNNHSDALKFGVQELEVTILESN